MSTRKKANWKETDIVRYKRKLKKLKKDKKANKKEIMRLRKIKDELKVDLKNLNIIVIRLINKSKKLFSYMKEYYDMKDLLSQKIKLLKAFQIEIREFKEEIKKFRIERQNIKNETKKLEKKLKKAQIKSRKKISRKFPTGTFRTTSFGDNPSSDSESKESPKTTDSPASPISIDSSKSNLEDYEPDNPNTSAVSLLTQ